jgi:hypothetical protein
VIHGNSVSKNLGRLSSQPLQQASGTDVVPTSDSVRTEVRSPLAAERLTRPAPDGRCAVAGRPRVSLTLGCRSDPKGNFVFLLVRRTRRTVLFSLCLLVALPVAAQSVASGAASASAVTATRAAFLKIVDRPRVPLAVEARSLAAPEPGLSAQHITFASDSIERVPTLLMKRQGSVGRGPAINPGGSSP